MIAAAASLGEAMTALQPVAEAAGLDMIVNTAGSNVLARQIEATAAVDVFLSADEAWVDHLENLGVVRSSTRRPWLSNRLVVIGHGPLERLEDLVSEPAVDLVLADPDAVPAGRYARAALRSVALDDGGTLWRRLADHIVPTADVRAALALVDARADLRGIVYATDAALARSAHVVAEVPPELSPPIRYVAVAMAQRPHPDRADRFLHLLHSTEARTIFQRLGFAVLD